MDLPEHTPEAPQMFRYVGQVSGSVTSFATDVDFTLLSCLTVERSTVELAPQTVDLHETGNSRIFGGHMRDEEEIGDWHIFALS